MRLSPLVIPLLLAPCVASGNAQSILQQTRVSVVTIATLDERQRPENNGSGVILEAGQVVTNCHVVDEASAIKVKSDSAEFPAILRLQDRERDLCLLEVKGLPGKRLPLRLQDDIAPGAAVYAIGNPLGLGVSVSSGLVSAVGSEEAGRLVFFDAAISPGSSGGGLFDAEGRLVGITTASLQAAQALNIAYPASWVAQLVRRGLPVGKPTGMEPEPDWVAQAQELEAAGNWSKLLDLTTQWQAAWPRDAGAPAVRAYALFRLQRYAEARQSVQEALRLDGRLMRAHLNQAQIDYALGDTAQAWRGWQTAADLAPQHPSVLGVKADWLRAEGKIGQARQTLLQLLRQRPGEAVSWWQLAEIWRAEGNLAEAQAALVKALRIAPSLDGARLALADVAARQGNSQAAQQLLKTEAGNSESRPQYWLNLALAEEKAGRRGEAERAAQKALELEPALSYAWLVVARCQWAGNRLAEAEQSLLKALGYQPKLVEGWVTLAKVRIELKRLIEAQQAAQQAVTIEPKTAEGWLLLADIARQRNEWPAALAAQQRLIALEAAKPLHWARLAEYQLRTGQIDAAEQSIQRAEQLDANHVDTLLVAALLQGQVRRQPAKALVYLQRATDLEPANTQAWSSKGYALLRLQRLPEARQALETAVRLDPGFAGGWINLGQVCLLQGDFGRSIVSLEKALQLQPTAADAQLYLAQAYQGSGQSERAQTGLDKLLQQQPQYAPAWQLRTVLALQLRQPQLAQQAYARLRALDPALAAAFKRDAAKRGLGSADELRD